MSQYSAKHIQVLKGLEAVRKRPGMYIGSTSELGLHHLVYEVVDNSVDEALAGHCDHICVQLEPDNFVRVIDNGRGIPIDIHPEEGVSALELVMTKLHAGGKFEKSSYKVSGGLHGVGVSVVNALSSFCEVSVYKAQKVYYQSYHQGIKQQEIQVLPFKETLSQKPYLASLLTRGTGTEVLFQADGSIFETLNYSFDVLAKRLRELTFLNQGITIVLRDLRKESLQESVFYFEGGIRSFIEYLNEGKQSLHEQVIYLQDEVDGVEMEAAFQWNSAYAENVFTYVNSIHTKEGGTHLMGLRTGLTRAMNSVLKDSKQAKKIDSSLEGEDVREGLVAVLSLKVPEPQFEGQTKTKLGNSSVKSLVEKMVYDGMQAFLEQNPKVAEGLLEKVVLAVNARMAARKARELMRRKSFLDTGGLPGKLADCATRNPQEAELFIVEGDSAGGTAKSGRDRHSQAILPLWGKMLNVEKARVEKVLHNDKLSPIIASLGTSVASDFDITKLRYHKVIIMADADVDGSHIRTLLLTFFFRYMQPLIEQGHLYLAMPPLYLLSHGKKKAYAYDDEAKEHTLQQWGLQEHQVSIQRYKGIGEMNADQLWDTTMDPGRRKLLQVALEDAIAADHIFSILMGSDVGPRRHFIEENALYVSHLDV